MSDAKPSSTSEVEEIGRSLNTAVITDSDVGSADSSGELNEKPKSKYYHFGTTDKEQAKNYVPQRIDPVVVDGSSKPTGVSSWNHGTTWEDKNMIGWAKKVMQALLEDEPMQVTGSSVQMSKTSVEGDASIVYSRGKPRIGFELKIKCTFKGDINGVDVEGEVEITELDEVNWEDSEYDLTVLSCSNELKSILSATIKAPIQSRIEKFVTEFKMQP